MLQSSTLLSYSVGRFQHVTALYGPALLPLHVRFSMTDALSFLVDARSVRDSMRACQRADLVENQASLWARGLLDMLDCCVSLRVCAELCCQQILLLLRCIHN